MPEKLPLRDKMIGTYLVQRLVAPIPGTGSSLDGLSESFAFGGGLKNGGVSEQAASILRGIFSFDYMGSAEFEWGAVPAALQFLADQARRGNAAAAPIFLPGDRILWLLAPHPYLIEAAHRVNLLYREKIRLKEASLLREALDGPSSGSGRVIGWLELDNGFLFFKDREAFEKMARLLGFEDPEDQRV